MTYAQGWELDCYGCRMANGLERSFKKKEDNTMDVQTGPSSTNGIERAGLTEQGRKEQFICHLQAIGVRCGDGRKEINEFYAKWDQMC